MAGKPGMHKKLLNPARAEEIRQKIKATLIINKLENHALGQEEMSATQITAALGLLKKCVPDLAAIELSGNEDKPVRLLAEWMKS
jgi:hypothetical protein